MPLRCAVEDRQPWSAQGLCQPCLPDACDRRRDRPRDGCAVGPEQHSRTPSLWSGEGCGYGLAVSAVDTLLGGHPARRWRTRGRRRGGRSWSARPPAPAALLPSAPVPDTIVFAPVVAAPTYGLPVRVPPPPADRRASHRRDASAVATVLAPFSSVSPPAVTWPRMRPAALPNECNFGIVCCSRGLLAVCDVR